MPEVLRCHVPYKHPLIRGTDLENQRFFARARHKHLVLSVITPLSRVILNTYTYRSSLDLGYGDRIERWTVRRYCTLTPKLLWVDSFGGQYSEYRLLLRDRILVTETTEEDEDELDPVVLPLQLTLRSNNLLTFLRGEPWPEDLGKLPNDPAIFADWLQDRAQYQKQAEWLRDLIASKV